MSQPSPPRPDLDKLLALASDLAQGGNTGSARTLFNALTREYPRDARPWLGLAAVATSPDERRMALERVLALDPENVYARNALQRLTEQNGRSGATAAISPTSLPSPPHPTSEETPVTARRAAGTAAAPPEPAEEERTRSSFPLLDALMSGVILILLLLLGVVIGRALLDGRQAANPPAAPTMPGNARDAPNTAVPSGAAGALAAPSPRSTAGPDRTPLQVTPPLPGPTPGEPAALPAPTLAAPPTIPPAPASLPLGTVVDHDGWSITLLRPDYAVTLDGAIGDLRPSGRFVLAVVAVSNNQPQPRRLPPDLFLVRDASGRAYTPVPGASSAYLALYERARRGDLALEDEFAPHSGMRSVPLLFDVPPDAQGLALLVSGAGPAGWPIGEATPPVTSGP
ncbi:MAG: hypothetical protein RMK84_07480 [Oscillochloridaceae bacterium]|nr:DUF4352 domain-containing protein [Chloroflexaceae bacterium]MDW8389950.1 hypothetical protein [Oscillochloridaceae bacterium]